MARREITFALVGGIYSFGPRWNRFAPTRPRSGDQRRSGAADSTTWCWRCLSMPWAALCRILPRLRLWRPRWRASRLRRSREFTCGSIARSATSITRYCSTARFSGCFTSRESSQVAAVKLPRTQRQLCGTGRKLLPESGGKIESGDCRAGSQRGARVFPGSAASETS